MGIFPDYYIIDSENEEVITLDLIKSYLRIDGDREDSLLQLFSRAAIEYAEYFTALSINTKLIEANFYQWKNQACHLPKYPIVEIEKVHLINAFGKKRKLKITEYSYNDKKIFLKKDDLIGYQLKVKYKAGFTLATIPPMLTEALLAHIGVMYETRSSESPPPIRVINTYLKYKQSGI